MNTPYHRPLILASSSPRRAELLREAGYSFEILKPDEAVECGVCSGESPPEMVARLAEKKAENVAEALSAGLIVACDTVAEWAGQALGKPADEDHARRMLQTLRGRTHRVYSGLCVWDIASGQPEVRVAKTTLQMEHLDDAQLDEYLVTGGWEGKAGAFGYQDRLGWVRIVEGSESNVVGLPMELLREMLAALGQ